MDSALAHEKGYLDRRILSTPCNGFLVELDGKTYHVIADFQLHVMDSSGAIKDARATVHSSFNSM
jgi:hypothetical protein